MIYLYLFVSFLKIGAFSFGGGYAMIPLIENEIIAVRKWLPIDEFLDVVAISQVTPGPIAVNSATFVGYKVAGIGGSIAATLGVTMPSFIIIIIIAFLVEKYRHTIFLDSFFVGVRPAVIALIIQAAFSVAKNSFSGIKDIALSLAVFLGLFTLKINPLLVILLAALIGITIY